MARQSVLAGLKTRSPGLEVRGRHSSTKVRVYRAVSFSAACIASFRRNQAGFDGASWPGFCGSRWRRQYRQRLQKWRSKARNARDSVARAGRGSRLEPRHGWWGLDLNEIWVAAWDNFQKNMGKES